MKKIVILLSSIFLFLFVGYSTAQQFMSEEELMKNLPEAQKRMGKLRGEQSNQRQQGYSNDPNKPFFVWPKDHKYDTPAKKRVAAAYMLEKACNQHLGWDPVVKADGVDKKLLVFESTRLTGTMSWYIAYEEKFGARAREVGFEKIYFIRQRYNAKEFDGWIFNVNTDRFE